MRITSLEVSGFRAFSGSERFDLDGDTVLVVGVNGQGKTSVFDAIQWAITGEIPRLGRPDSIVSLYSASGEARVEVTLSSNHGSTLVVTRHSDGQRDNLLLREGRDEFRGENAEYELLRRLWPDGLTPDRSRASLCSAFQRGVYLQQDALTDFLTADTDQNRFNAISDLIGTGRATELQVALESSRSAWSRATNQMESGMADLENRLTRIKSQITELTEVIPTLVLTQDDWSTWWTQAKHLGVSDIHIPSIHSSDAHSAIDIAVGELRAIESSHERRQDQLRTLATQARELPPKEFDLDALRREAEELSQALHIARANLAEAESRVAIVRRRQLEARLEQQDLRVLAEVALRHLGEHCPVCKQTYDINSTRERLESILRTDPNTAISEANVPDLAEMIDHIQTIEDRASAAATALQEAQHQEGMRTAAQERIRVGLIELVDSISHENDYSSMIEAAMGENAHFLERLSEVRKRGEALALSLARSGRIARRGELEHEAILLSRNLETTRNEIRVRRDTGEQVSRVIDALRYASSDLVENELGRLEPLLQRIYATADPHPEFRVVKLISRMRRGRGRVLAELNDPLHGHSVDTPSAFLSSSQLNVLAVSVFLALNLGLPTLPLRLAILDDPLQSLDDLNLLGLIDLLKRMRERRQLMISTHDVRFASLLERKLRPVSALQRTILVELDGWNSEGPTTMQRDITPDPVPFRIAVA